LKEHEIISLIKNRDEQGIEELIKYYGPLIRYIITPIIKNHEDIEECASEVTMRVWEKIDMFDSHRGSWTTWLTYIARNTALNKTRSNKHITEEIADDIPSHKPTPEETILMTEMKIELSRALATLSSADKALFYRKYYYLQSTSQIASELGMTERSVEGKLYRLKKRLRKMLGGDQYE